MEFEEFNKIIEGLAEDYAKNMVDNPEEHEDAVMCIKEDYLSGALDAFNLLKSNN